MAVRVSLRSPADDERQRHTEGVCPAGLGSTDRDDPKRSWSPNFQHKSGNNGNGCNGRPTKITPHSFATKGAGVSHKYRRFRNRIFFTESIARVPGGYP